jgi:hypothetical protein
MFLRARPAIFDGLFHIIAGVASISGARKSIFSKIAAMARR